MAGSIIAASTSDLETGSIWPPRTLSPLAPEAQRCLCSALRSSRIAVGAGFYGLWADRSVELCMNWLVGVLLIAVL